MLNNIDQILLDWQSGCLRCGWAYHINKADTKRFQTLLEDFKPAQIRWSIDAYFKQTAIPSVKDFISYMDTDSYAVPHELVCAAYMSDDDKAKRLADMWQHLDDQWFPSAKDQAEKEQIQEQLHRRVLAWL